MKKTLFLIAAILVIATMAFGQVVSRADGYTGRATSGIASGTANLGVSTWQFFGPYDISDCRHMMVSDSGRSTIQTDTSYAVTLGAYLYNDCATNIADILIYAYLSPFYLKVGAGAVSSRDSLFGPSGAVGTGAKFPSGGTVVYVGATAGKDSASVFASTSTERILTSATVHFTNVNPSYRYLYLKFVAGSTNTIANTARWGIGCGKY